ncbi:MAG: hypothetical protein C0504_18660 [Candidatus Solibacter sp.]|nr:hypothetical protein [Candidatus Solibacter sp.]
MFGQPAPQRAGSSDPGLDIREYTPKSSLVVPAHPKTRAKYPFIDAHNHQRFPMPADRSKQLLAGMDSLILQIMVNLSGGHGERLKAAVDFARATAPPG